MKPRHFFWLVFVFILGAPQVSFSAPPKPSWIEFVSKDFNFSVLFPTKPISKEEPARLTHFQELAKSGLTYECPHPKFPETYKISVIELKTDFKNEPSRNFLLDTAHSLAKSYFTSESPKSFVSDVKKFEDHDVVDYGVKIDQKKGVLGRLIISGNLVYNIEFIYKYPFHLRSWEGFWRSFDLSTPETRDAKAQKERKILIQSLKMWNGL